MTCCRILTMQFFWGLYIYIYTLKFRKEKDEKKVEYDILFSYHFI